MSRIVQLFNDIQKRFPNSFVTTPTSLKDSVFDFHLYDRHVIPRVPYDIFKSIGKNAMRGDIVDMRVVSMFYAVGLGVPRDETHCMYWAQMSVCEASCVDIEKVVEKLRNDIIAAKSNFVYPQYVFDDRSKLLPKNIRLETPMFGNRMRIFPVYSGMQLNLIYRFNEKECHLYDAFNRTDDFSLEHLYRLQIPLTLSKFKPNYKATVKNLTNVDPDAMVVSGTLVIPKRLMKFVKAKYPDAKSVSDLFEHFRNDKRDRHTMDNAERDKILDQVAKLQKRIDAVVSGAEAKSVNAEYKEVYASYSETKDEQLANKLRDLKDKFTKLKNGEILQTLQSQLNVKNTQLAEFANESEELHYSYLENVFEFIPNDMFVTNSDGVVVMPLRSSFKSHAQSLGFKVVGELCEYSDKVDVNALVSKFTNENYTLRAFNVRRVESVNNKSYTIALEV